MQSSFSRCHSYQTSFKECSSGKRMRKPTMKMLESSAFFLKAQPMPTFNTEVIIKMEPISPQDTKEVKKVRLVKVAVFPRL